MNGAKGTGMNGATRRRRYVALASGMFTTHAAKSIHGIIAYGDDRVVAVIDPALEGRGIRDVLPHLDSDAPIVAELHAALDRRPNALLISATPPGGGTLPEGWRATILSALRAGLEVVSALDTPLGDDPEFAEAAYLGGAQISDISTMPLRAMPYTGSAATVKPYVLLTVGSDCGIGVTTATLELAKAARERGRRVEFLATSITGRLISGKGVAIERVATEQAAGAVESLVCGHLPESEVLVVEGQGSIHHPATAAVTMALLGGAAPDGLVLVHEATRVALTDLGTPVLPLSMLRRLYETLVGTIKPAPVVGIVANTRGLNDRDARATLTAIHEATELPVGDIIRYGGREFYDAVADRLRTKTQRLA